MDAVEVIIESLYWCSFLYPHFLELCIIHSRCSTNVSWMNEKNPLETGVGIPCGVSSVFIHSFIQQTIVKKLLCSYSIRYWGCKTEFFILEFLKRREVGFGTCRRIDIISVYKAAMVDVYFSSPTNRGGGDGSFFPKDPGPETLLGRVLVKWAETE